MHYYQFNIADYRKDTQHLNAIEHYIYRELIDWYYLDEQPIPKKTQSVLRRLRLVSENNQDLINVLDEFFVETDAGWSHSRIEEEIAKYRAKADTARANGNKGGRPKKPKKTQPVNLANPEITGSKANHKPLTINHKPLIDQKSSGDKSPLSKKKQTRFIKPTLDQCIDHCKNREESEGFINFYESKGWMVGKNKMVSWKHALTGWINRGKKGNERQQNTSVSGNAETENSINSGLEYLRQLERETNVSERVCEVVDITNQPLRTSRLC